MFIIPHILEKVNSIKAQAKVKGRYIQPDIVYGIY